MAPLAIEDRPDAPQNTFVAPGSIAHDSSIDDLLEPSNKSPDVSDCAAALQYVNTPGAGFDKDLAIEVAKFQAYKDGLVLVQNTKNDLLSDSWWRTSPAPMIAARIKYYANGFQDLMSAANPAAAEIGAAKDALLKTLTVAASSIKAAYEHSESVKSAAEAASEAAEKELENQSKEDLAKQLGLGKTFSMYKALQDYEELVRTSNDAYQYRQTVQRNRYATSMTRSP